MLSLINVYYDLRFLIFDFPRIRFVGQSIMDCRLLTFKAAASGEPRLSWGHIPVVFRCQEECVERKSNPCAIQAEATCSIIDCLDV